jgi:hypothetical protein
VKVSGGGEVEYEGIKSGKIKVGCVGRYKKGKIEPYAGMWHEEKILGEMKGKAAREELPVSKMKGRSVIGEVGGRMEKEEVRLELGVKGYAGNRQGVEGALKVGYKV